MSSVNVSVKPEIIKWALEQSPDVRLDKQTSADVDGWISGEKTPTLSKIEKFSREVHMPLGYFFLQSPPEEDVGLLKYRTLGNRECEKPSRNLIDTIYGMQDVQDWMRDYRIENGFEKNSVVGCVHGIMGVSGIVRVIREDLRLDETWYERGRTSRDSFSTIRERLEMCGVMVIVDGVVGCNNHRPLDVEEFRAFAMADEWAPLIFINGKDSDGARLFSLLHETVHIWIGADDLYNASFGETDGKRLETTCNAVTAELLVPADVFSEAWEKTQGDVFDRIAMLAKHFRCSSSVVARRALDFEKISVNEYETAVDSAAKAVSDGFGKRQGGSYYNTQSYRLDRGLMAALHSSIIEGRTTYTEACRLTHTKPDSFLKIADRMGV